MSYLNTYFKKNIITPSYITRPKHRSPNHLTPKYDTPNIGKPQKGGTPKKGVIVHCTNVMWFANQSNKLMLTVLPLLMFIDMPITISC